MCVEIGVHMDANEHVALIYTTKTIQRNLPALLDSQAHKVHVACDGTFNLDKIGYKTIILGDFMN
jgi:Leu/Phe-tRNA-protein transferase